MLIFFVQFFYLCVFLYTKNAGVQSFLLCGKPLPAHNYSSTYSTNRIALSVFTVAQSTCTHSVLRNGEKGEDGPANLVWRILSYSTRT